MKKYLLIAMTVSLLLGVGSCKTTEKNYRDSYEKAIEKKREGIDSLTYARIENEKQRATALVNGDSVRIVTESVSMIDGGFHDIRNYGVVVASFKQVFNARSLRDRINDAAKEKTSYVVLNRRGDYYVIPKGFSKKEEAADYLKNLKKNVKVGIPLAHPWILEVP